MGTGQAYTPLRERLHTLLLVSTVGAGALVLFFLRLSAEAGHQIHPSAASAASFNFDLDSVELPFKEQMELYGSTRLLISYHGAQLTNVAFMMDDAAVIEIFNCRHFADTYERTALESGLVYFAARPTKAGCEVPSPKRHAVGNLNRSVPIDEITPILGKVKRKLRL